MDATRETETPAFRGRLFRKYAGYFAGLLSFALLVSGFTNLYFSYRDTRLLVDELQREKARAAASRIEQFMQGVESQARAPVALRRAGGADLEHQYMELLKLLQLAPAVTDAAWIDAQGRERVRASRVLRDIIGSEIDRSGDAAVIAAAAGKVWHGAVYFRRDTEPYLSIAVPGMLPELGIVVAEINLKSVWDVISSIRLGKTGHAYVVDASGQLIAHPDISRVLRKADLSGSAAVRAALRADAPPESFTVVARNERAMQTFTAYAPIPALGWIVLAEQPLAEAFAPVYGSAARALVVIVLGVALAIAAGFVLARRMVAPIESLQAGARRIGDGRLEETVSINTGDELQGLAEQFNSMAHQLRESYANLEQKIAARTAELTEANLSKSRFLAAASHDLRQPAHALGLFIAQLEDAQDPEQVRRLIKRVSTSSAAVSELLDALLDISKLDAGTVEPQHTHFHVQTLFDRVEHTLGLTARAKELRLRVRPTALCVHTDPVLLERILLNLAINAVRYVQTGGVLVGARRRGERVSIEVWDTGVGIPLEEQQRIFEEFYRLPGAQQERSKGLGLGLAIVRRLARLLDLPVSVVSVPRRGSKFAVSVPISQHMEADPRAAPPIAGRVLFDAPPVLLIDDERAAREAAAGLLTQWGCRVATAGSGAEAHALLDGSAPPPALIVCDYRLGDHECGTAVARSLSERLGAAIPTLIVSADVTPALTKEAAAAGYHLLQKPLKVAKLRALLKHVL